MKKVNAELFTDLKDFLKDCDVVTINVPLSDKTRGMFDAETIKSMKDGAYLINNARGAIVDAKAVSLCLPPAGTRSFLKRPFSVIAPWIRLFVQIHNKVFSWKYLLL